MADVKTWLERLIDEMPQYKGATYFTAETKWPYMEQEIADLRTALQAQQGDVAREQALHAAVAAIYFDDSSDYKSALGTVVRHLDPALAGELLGHPKAAYDKSLARVDAAMLAARREG